MMLPQIKYITHPIYKHDPLLHNPFVIDYTFIYGGTFDIFHNGHFNVFLKIFETIKVLNEFTKHRTLFRANFYTYPTKIQKRPNGLSYEDRLLLLKRNVYSLQNTFREQHPKIQIDFRVVEIESSAEQSTTYSSTYETLSSFLKQNNISKSSTYIVISEDIDLKTWKHYPKIVEEYGFIVLTRDDIHSSTNIYEKIKNKEDITSFIPIQTKYFLEDNGILK